MLIKHCLRRVILLSLACLLVGCNREPEATHTPQPLGLSRKSYSEGEKPDPYIADWIPVCVAIATAANDPYSNMFAAGCRDAAAELDVELELGLPTERSVADQDEVCQELSRLDVAGIAVNPIDPDAQIQTINQLNSEIPTLTFGTDSPGSDRHFHIGVDDYQIGLDCGRLIASLLPEGGNVVLLTDRLDGGSASLRRQGLIDAVLDRNRSAEHYRSGQSGWDTNDDPIAGELLTIVETLIDDQAAGSAGSQLQKKLNSSADLKMVVGLHGSCIPECLSAMNQADIPAGIKWGGLGYDEALVQCIQTGQCDFAIIADPYPLGKETLRLLKDAVQLQHSKLPKNLFATTPAIEVTPDNVEMLLNQWQAATAREDSTDQTN